MEAIVAGGIKCFQPRACSIKVYGSIAGLLRGSLRGFCCFSVKWVMGLKGWG
jgi:hypothetical protein